MDFGRLTILQPQKYYTQMHHNHNFKSFNLVLKTCTCCTTCTYTLDSYHWCCFNISNNIINLGTMWLGESQGMHSPPPPCLEPGGYSLFSTFTLFAVSYAGKTTFTWATYVILCVWLLFATFTSILAVYYERPCIHKNVFLRFECQPSQQKYRMASNTYSPSFWSESVAST